MNKLKPFLLGLLVVLTGCTASHWDPSLGVPDDEGHHLLQSAAHSAPPPPVKPEKPEKKPKESPKSQRMPGNGVFIKPESKQGNAQPPKPGDITLNFENTDIREVVKVVLGDLLSVNYILSPAVQGTVTMETGRPLTRELLMPTLETLLRMNKAALVYKDGVYNVLPTANATQGVVTPQLGESNRPLPKGYSVRIVPLTYIGAAEMSKILKPLASEGSIIRVDAVRNLLVLAGSGPEISNLLETVDMFDVNWIKGLSVGLFRIQHGDLKDVMKQIDTLTSDKDDNPLSGMFRVIPIEAANSLLVVTHQQEYLDQIGTWIDWLDQAGSDNGTEPTLYVYRVKHGDADSLAQILGQIFSDGKSASKTGSAPRVAPGLRGASIRSGSSSFGSSSMGKSSSTGLGSSSLSSGSSTGSSTTTGTTGGSTGATAQATGYQLGGGVNVVSDTVNNSLLIRATPAQYREISGALDKLDILPLQVLVEATIVEVSLTGDLKYGLEWFFQAHKGGYTGKVTWDNNIDGGTSGGISSGLLPGFSWGLINSADETRAMLSAFAGDGLVKVLSSPSVMVLDNHTAHIQVGDQVPILTSQQQSTLANSYAINTIEYRDTGVLLSVTPRVTPGGLVIMEVQQEVSDVSTTKTGVSGSPTISTRNIASTVAVKDGQVVVLGGLIKDQKGSSQGGIPGLYKVPVVGWMFGQVSKSASRTELLIILTPKVLRNDDDNERITDDFRNKLQGLKSQL